MIGLPPVPFAVNATEIAPPVGVELVTVGPGGTVGGGNVTVAP